MTLKDMKIERKEVDEAKDTVLGSSDMDYPYGLSLNLDEETIQKLGMEKMPSPGNDVYIMAKASVESASITKESDKQNRSLRLQIKKLNISDSSEGMNVEEESERVGIEKPKDGPSIHKVLYGD